MGVNEHSDWMPFRLQKMMNADIAARKGNIALVRLNSNRIKIVPERE